MNPVALLFPLASAAAMVASLASGLAVWRPEGASAFVAAPASVQPDSMAAGAREHAVARAKDGLFYVDARVNGEKVRFLVDTGATHIVLTARDARRIGLAPSRGGRLRTAGGRVSMGWARVRRLTVAGHEAHGLRVAVAGGGLPVSLLGQDMLARLSSVRIEANRLVLAS